MERLAATGTSTDEVGFLLRVLAGAAAASGDVRTRLLGVLTDFCSLVGAQSAECFRLVGLDSQEPRIQIGISVDRRSELENGVRGNVGRQFWISPLEPVVDKNIVAILARDPGSTVNSVIGSCSHNGVCSHEPSVIDGTHEPGSCICTTIPNTDSGEAWGIMFTRNGRQRPFHEHERALIERFHVGIEPLIAAVWALPAGPGPMLEALPPRLRRILECLLKGDSEKQVASKLGLSQHTVHTYVKQPHRRFAVNSRGELLALCLSSK